MRKICFFKREITQGEQAGGENVEKEMDWKDSVKKKKVQYLSLLTNAMPREY